MDGNTRKDWGRGRKFCFQIHKIYICARCWRLVNKKSPRIIIPRKRIIIGRIFEKKGQAKRDQAKTKTLRWNLKKIEKDTRQNNNNKIVYFMDCTLPDGLACLHVPFDCWAPELGLGHNIIHLPRKVCISLFYCFYDPCNTARVYFDIFK